MIAHMRRYVLFIITSVFLFLACTGSERKTTSVVRINISSEPDSLDPWQSAAADTASIFDNVFEGLLKASPDGKLIPCIAKNYSISEDKLTYSFSLNKNIVFHNGQKLTSKDVLFTYNRLTGLDGKSCFQ